MSEAKDAHEAYDFFVTPQWVVDAGINLLMSMPLPLTYQDQIDILDPGAGTGIWGAAIHKKLPKAYITGVEIRPTIKPPEYDYWVQKDFLEFTKEPQELPYHIILGNPPYGKQNGKIMSEEFVKASLKLLAPGGILLFLLRLAFLSGQKRAKEIYKENPPKRIDVLSKRPSFTSDGHSDTKTEYALFTWQKEWTGGTYGLFLWEKGRREGTEVRWILPAKAV